MNKKQIERENKSTLSEIEFALKNGFDKIEIGKEIDGSTFFWGTFGYISTNDEELIEAINKLISSYKGETVNMELTEKELKVFNCLIENTFEYGLPVDVDTIKEETGMSKRSIVGVISSLYKKEVVEEYVVCGEDMNEFILCEKYCD